MGFIGKLRLYLSNREILSRIFFTVLILFFFRLLSKVPVPGIERDALETIFGKTDNTLSLFNLANILSGGTLSQFSIISIGLFSFISASVIFQLLSPIVPKINELRKMGEVGTKVIDQWTRILTVFISALQAYLLYFALSSANNIFGRQLVEDLSPLRVVALVSVLVAGTMLLLWLAELCSEFGLGGRRGGGVSLIISAGILSALPPSLVKAFSNFTSSDYLQNFWITFAVEWLLFFVALAIFVLVILVLKSINKAKNRLIRNLLFTLLLVFVVSVPFFVVFLVRSESDFVSGIKTLFATNFARLDTLETRFAFYLGLTIQIIMITVFFNESLIKVPIKFVNRLDSSSRLLSENISFLPVKLLSVGVMPIIFSSSLLLMPEVVYRFFGGYIKNWDGKVNLWQWSFSVLSPDGVKYFYQILEYASVSWLNQTTSYYYHILHFIFTVLFSMFFIYIVIDPENLVNSLRRSKSYIVGIRPGAESLKFVSYTILRVAFWGGIVLGFVSSLPFLLGLYTSNLPLGIEALLAGGTSILILIPTLLGIKSQLDALVINKDYDRFLDV